MIRTTLIFFLVGVAAVHGFSGSAAGSGAGYAQGKGALGAQGEATGTINTGGKIAGKAHLGQGNVLGGLFDFSNANVEGQAEGNLAAEGTASGSFGGAGNAAGAAVGKGYAQGGF